ncbi:MarR family transcriptional regulator [Lentzea tibetensis]|uniref:MarR family transcriptional regulator n=2 Tax=Lentzea tibetensis TaxID=2591470 RepID=A0A563EK46_9PSEU|nr:MarR family transcriptional regulator [Lentzea tibetensis]
MCQLFRYTGGVTQETRWLDAGQQQAWRAYLRMQGELNARLSRDLQANSDLSMADFAVLVHLTDVPDGRVRVLELARNLHWEKSRISHHIGRMEKRGLVRRENCRSDGRGAFVVLTDEGREAIEAAAPRHVEQVRELMFDNLTDEEVAVLARISQRVVDKLTTACDEPA